MHSNETVSIFATPGCIDKMARYGVKGSVIDYLREKASELELFPVREGEYLAVSPDRRCGFYLRPPLQDRPFRDHVDYVAIMYLNTKRVERLCTGGAEPAAHLSIVWI